MTQWRLPLLFVILVGLLTWLRISDRPSPSYPHGQFFPVVLEAMLVVAVVGGVVQLWRGWPGLAGNESPQRFGRANMNRAFPKPDESIQQQEPVPPNRACDKDDPASFREGLPPQAPAWDEATLALPDPGYGQSITAQPRSQQSPAPDISPVREGLPPPLSDQPLAPEVLAPNPAEPPDWAIHYAAKHLLEGSKAFDIEQALIRQGLPPKLAAQAVERWFHQVFAKENKAIRMATRRWFWSVVLTFVAGSLAFLGALLLGDHVPYRWRLGLAFAGVGCFIGGYVLFRIGWSLTVGERDFRQIWRNVTRPPS